MKTIMNLFKDESGATAIEYGLIAALISIAAIAAMTYLGGTVSNTFSKVATNMSAGR